MKKIDFEVIVNRRIKTSLFEWLREEGFTSFDIFQSWAKENEDKYLFTEQFMQKVKLALTLIPTSTIMSGSSILTPGYVYAPYIPIEKEVLDNAIEDLQKIEDKLFMDNLAKASSPLEESEEPVVEEEDSQAKVKGKKNKNKQVHSDPSEE